MYWLGYLYEYVIQEPDLIVSTSLLLYLITLCVFFKNCESADAYFVLMIPLKWEQASKLKSVLQLISWEWLPGFFYIKRKEGEWEQDSGETERERECVCVCACVGWQQQQSQLKKHICRNKQ